MALEFNTQGSGNAAIGAFAMRSNTTGHSNVAVGSSVLESNATGFFNVGIGPATLATNTDGYGNVAIGGTALQMNTTGFSNAAIGVAAMRANVTGSSNSAFGHSALDDVTNGVNNSAFGSSALGSLTNGNGNIALGIGAGMGLVKGHANIYIGSEGAASESTTIRIGQGQGATFVAGIHGQQTNSGGIPVLVSSDGKLGTSSSSLRSMVAVADMGVESEVLLLLRPVGFNEQGQPESPEGRQYGLVAEEVAVVAPQLVVLDTSGSPQAVRYDFIISMLVNEFQKQHLLLESQESQIRALENRLERLAVTFPGTAR